MLGKLLVILGFFLTVSFGQPPDCKAVPQTKESCCMMPEESADKEEMECKTEHKEGTELSSCELNTCILKKQNFLLSDNKIDKAAVAKNFKESSPEIFAAVENSLEKCYPKTEKSKCPPEAFLMCLYNTMMRDCPSAFWRKTEECTTLKKFLVDCPNADILALE